ncbi:hypothetical protein [Halosimplex sp. J119]
MAGLSRSTVITWLRSPEWGALSFITSLGIITGSVVTSIKGISQIVLIIFGIVIFSAFLAANYYLSGIGMVCLQTDPSSSAKNHYMRSYPIPDGYAEFDVYLNIPHWLDSFSVEIQHDGPFTIAAWELPDPVSFNNEVIHCDGDLKKVPFVLRFGGEPQEIGDATYQVKFIDSKTERTIYSISLNGDSRVETDLSFDDIDQDVVEALEIDEPETD